MNSSLQDKWFLRILLKMHFYKKYDSYQHSLRTWSNTVYTCERRLEYLVWLVTKCKYCCFNTQRTLNKPCFDEFNLIFVLCFETFIIDRNVLDDYVRFRKIEVHFGNIYLYHAQNSYIVLPFNNMFWSALKVIYWRKEKSHWNLVISNVVTSTKINVQTRHWRSFTLVKPFIRAFAMKFPIASSIAPFRLSAPPFPSMPGAIESHLKRAFQCHDSFDTRPFKLLWQEMLHNSIVTSGLHWCKFHTLLNKILPIHDIKSDLRSSKPQILLVISLVTRGMQLLNNKVETRQKEYSG